MHTNPCELRDGMLVRDENVADDTTHVLDLSD